MGKYYSMYYYYYDYTVSQFIFGTNKKNGILITRVAFGLADTGRHG